MRSGLGQVCGTGTYRSTEHVKFPKFQTGIFVEWKLAPQIHWIQVDGSCIWKEKVADSKISGYLWMGPKISEIVNCRLWTKGTMQTVD